MLRFPTFEIGEDGRASGSYNGAAVIAAIPFSGDAIVLFEPDLSHRTGRRSQNLVRVRASGGERWAATPPDSPDYFSDFKLSDGELLAWSFSGYRLVVNLETGRTLSQSFTK